MSAYRVIRPPTGEVNGYGNVSLTEENSLTFDGMGWRLHVVVTDGWLENAAGEPVGPMPFPVAAFVQEADAVAYADRLNEGVPQ